MQSDSRATELTLLLLFAGPLFVMYGLDLLNKKRLIQNTPRSKVRSAAIGLVELRGTAEAQHPMKAPVSGLPCAWWHCRVQEYISSGKHSEWRTVKDCGSQDLFFIVDETGKVPVNPWRAEMRVPQGITGVDSSTRTALGPLLQSWGVDGLHWFSLGRPLRIIEQYIFDGGPLFVFGELMTLAESPESRDARRRAFILAAKKDATRVASADTNKDGQIDAQEWDTLRATLEIEFDQNEQRKTTLAGTQQSVIVHAPVAGAFVISTEPEEDFLKALSWQAPISMLGGTAASALGAWLAIMLDWSPVWIVVVIGTAFIVKMLFKKGSVSISFQKL